MVVVGIKGHAVVVRHEPELGVAVGFKCFVIVEVVLGDIGQYFHGEL